MSDLRYRHFGNRIADPADEVQGTLKDMADGSFAPVVYAVVSNVTTAPLPSNASTEATLIEVRDAVQLGATEATLQQIRDAVRAQVDLASTVWTDDTGTFYVRRDNIDQFTGVVTVTFTDPVGAPAAPGAGLRPAAGGDNQVTTELFEAVAAGAGYSIGDTLGRVLVIGLGSTPPTVETLWLNLSTGLTLPAAPSVADIVAQAASIAATQSGVWTVAVSSAAALPLPAGASTDANQVLELLALADLNDALLDVHSVVADLATEATLEQLNAKVTTAGTRVRTADSLPNADTAAIQAVATHATVGATYIVLAPQACMSLQIVNPTDTIVEYQRAGAGAAMPVMPYGGSALVVAITNANQIGIRRRDQAATSVTVAVETFGIN